jgi:hypothetical protein
MREHFMAGHTGSVIFTYPVVGVYRHDTLMCDDPRTYHVVICIDELIVSERSFAAVVDDFGNLVRVQ